MQPARKLAAAALALSLTSSAWADLGLDLTRSGRGKLPTPPPPPAAQPATAGAAPVTMPELDLGARPGDAGKRTAEANALLAKGDVEAAALAYHAILAQPALAEAHDEARYQLAKCLARLGLPHAALNQVGPVLSKGPQGSRWFYNALELLFQAGRSVNEPVLVSLVARYAKDALPPASQDRFNYLLARYSYERGQALDELGRAAEAKKAYEETRRLVALVRPEAGATRPAGDAAGAEGDVHARARFLDGLAQYAQGQSQAAVESFKEVVRLTHPKRGRAPDARIRELAFLQLARIHYEYKQNRYAIFYYGRMPWGGESWLEGLWEASYAHYRIGDYEKALGNLLTLQSPYFRDAWYPESYILKAIVYYENCRYPEARSILDDFRAAFAGVHAELDALTGKQAAPGAFYDLLLDAQKGRGAGATPGMKRIFALALTDQNVRRLHDAIVEVEARGGHPPGRPRRRLPRLPLATALREGLVAERRRLVDEAGARARAKLEYERDALRDLLAGRAAHQDRGGAQGARGAGERARQGRAGRGDPRLPLLHRRLRRAPLLALRRRVLARRAGHLHLHPDQGVPRHRRALKRRHAAARQAVAARSAPGAALRARAEPRG